MIALGANLDQLHKICGTLRTQIIAANSDERIFQNDFGERVQIGFAASHDRDFSLKKQVELSGKRTFLAARAFRNRLNAAQRVRAPRYDQTRVAEFSFPKKNCLCAFHSPESTTQQCRKAASAEMLSDASLQHTLDMRRNPSPFLKGEASLCASRLWSACRINIRQRH